MPPETAAGGTSIVDVLDRILDKGLVIDAFARVSVIGLEVLTVEARVVVASVDTYLRYADAIGLTRLASRPGQQPSQSQLPQGQPALTQGPSGQTPGSLLGGVGQQLQGGQGQQGQQAQLPGAAGGQQAIPADLGGQLRGIAQQLRSNQGGGGGQGAGG